MNNQIDQKDKVWVSVVRTVNTGNYENIKIEMGTSQTIGEEDPSQLRLRICNDLLSEVVQTSNECKENLTYTRQRRGGND